MHYKRCEICGVRSGRVHDQKRIFLAKFPLDKERCKEWVKVTGKEDLAYVPIEKLHELKYICGKHFRPKDFKKKKTQLRKKAIPSLLITAKPLSDDILKGFPLHVSGNESPPAQTVEQDEFNEESDDDGCNPAVSAWIKKLHSVRTKNHATKTPIKSSDDNVKTEEITSCLNTNEQDKYVKSDELPTDTALATEGSPEAEDKGAESPPAQTVEQDEFNEESDDDGCNPAFSTWIKKLHSDDTTNDATETPIKSSDDNVRTEEGTSCLNTNEQEKYDDTDELPTDTALATEGSPEAEDKGSLDQIGDVAMDTCGEEEIECARKEELSARCCACLSNSSQLTLLESIEIMVRPGVTQHFDALYTDLTGLEVPDCVGGAMMCEECVSRLTVAYMFKLQCVESHALLTSSSALLPPPTRDHQQSTPGSPAGCPPSQDESATHTDEVLEEAECLTLPVASASPYVDDPSGPVNELSSADCPSTETKVTSSLINIKDNKRKNAEQLNTGSSKRSYKILKYKENEIKLKKCQSCEKATAADAEIELAIQLTMQYVCCICTKSFRDSAALREHARTSHSANFQGFLSIATNVSRMCTCNYNKNLLKIGE